MSPVDVGAWLGLALATGVLFYGVLKPSFESLLFGAMLWGACFWWITLS